jgi:molecular chaperone DnaK
MGGIATHLIERNTTIPTHKSQIFSTAQDNQDAVDINIVQGEREFAKDNKSLGRFRLDGIAPARRGVPQIEVTFDIDANGIVNVSAQDLGTGREQHITITSGTSLSDDDIDRAIKEAKAYEEADKKRKEGVEVRNDADAIVFQTEKALNEVGDKLPEADKKKVEEDLASLKTIIDGTDIDNLSDYDIEKLKAGRETLMTSAQNLFAKLYEQNGPGANAGTGTGTPDFSSNDDVVDGDFKEV